MRSQTSTVPLSLTNFLREGAFYREGTEWTLFAGPFQPLIDGQSSDISIHWPLFWDLDSFRAVSPANQQSFSTEELRVWLAQSLSELGSNQLAHLGPRPRTFDEPLFSDFETDFNEIQKQIHLGNLQKAVPVVFAESQGSLSMKEKLLTLTKLTIASDSLIPYGYWDSLRGVIGASPETLFQIDSQAEELILKTMALAGTLPKNWNVNSQKYEAQTSEQIEKFFQDPKEVSEHEFVVNDIVQKLIPMGAVTWGKMQIMELPALYHLRTNIEAKLSVFANPKNEISSLQIKNVLKVMHPTPALGVAVPEDKKSNFDYQWLKNLSSAQWRDGFGSPFTIRHKGKVISLVAIRNIIWDQSKVILGSGCGVVQKSDVTKEWKELSAKRKSVINVLGLTPMEN